MIAAWRIDSLDVLAGLAFARFRRADLEGEAPPLDRAAVFLSPPTFAPEALGSRVTGFAAARGQAQLGLFVDSREIAFETLEALTEFVRRLYMRGGAGDGPEGEPLPRSPSPEDPDGSGASQWVPDAGPRSEVVSGLISIGKQARAAIEDLKMDEWNATFATSLKSDVPQTDPTDGGQTLAIGASELLFELLASGRVGRLSSAELQIWYVSLTADMAGMGLWGIVRDMPTWPAIRDLAELIRIDAILGFVGPFHELWYRDLLFDHFLLASASTGDPLDDLAEWILPDAVARQVELPHRPASALALLSAPSAGPQRLAGGDLREVQSAAAIALFASAHVVLGGTRISSRVAGDNRGVAGYVVVQLHPGAADGYRRLTENLHLAVGGDDGEDLRRELRQLIEYVEFVPLQGLGKFELQVHGRLATLLRLGGAQTHESPAASGSGASSSSDPTAGKGEVKVGAGAGFEPATFRL